MATDVETTQMPEQQDNAGMDSPPLRDDGASASPPLPPPSSPPLPLPDPASALPPDAASKRHRRPNVRLNEIGSESSLANVVEYLLKHKSHSGSGVEGGKRGRPPKIASSGKLLNKSKPLPTLISDVKHSDGDDKSKKLSSDGDDEDVSIHVGDGNAEHHAEDIKPRGRKPYKRQNLISKEENRKVVGLAKNHNIGTAITKHTKRPKLILPCAEGNGNNWMQKTADGFLEAADGCVYACSDTEKRVHSPLGRANPAIYSSKDLKTTQATTKLKKKVGSRLKQPSRTEYAHKDKVIEEKEEPSSSALQELRTQGPVWERGVPPLDEKVKDWMQKIGLEKYAPIFQHHEVGDDVVPLLTMDDLKEMGIRAVGARRKFFSEVIKRRQSTMLADKSLAEEM